MMILQIKGLHKSFGKTQVIFGVNLEIEHSECHAIIGPNGAGKSTLFNLISGLYKPSSGNIKLKGEEIVGLSPFEIYRRGLSRSFQVLNIFRNMSVFENIRCALLWQLGYKYSFWQRTNTLKEVQERAEMILNQIGMTNRRDVIAGALSYGEQRRLEIGITIGSGAEIILLDEPTAGLSKPETEEVVKLIHNVTKGKTLLLVEHDMNVVFAISHRISVLVYGQIIATGEPEMIKQNRQVQEAYLGTFNEKAA
jgi:branched-chain amino acid transport system ATP-binding protein